MGSEDTDPLEKLMAGIEEKSDASRLVELFLDKEGIEGKTDLTKDEIYLFWVLSIWHKKYPGLGYDLLGHEYMHLKVSENGKSRKGVIELVKNLFGGGQNPSLPPGEQQAPLRKF